MKEYYNKQEETIKLVEQNDTLDIKEITDRSEIRPTIVYVHKENRIPIGRYEKLCRKIYLTDPSIVKIVTTDVDTSGDGRYYIFQTYLGHTVRYEKSMVKSLISGTMVSFNYDDGSTAHFFTHYKVPKEGHSICVNGEKRKRILKEDTKNFVEIYEICNCSGLLT